MRRGRRSLSNALGSVGRGTRAVLADRLLQILILGTIGAAFFFVIVLKADAFVVFGVLGVGCATAFIESAHHRKKD